jgi:hypothetical protein
MLFYVDVLLEVQRQILVVPFMPQAFRSQYNTFTCK